MKNGKWSNYISILRRHAKFHYSWVISLVLAMHTSKHTYGKTFYKNHLFGLRGPQYKYFH